MDINRVDNDAEHVLQLSDPLVLLLTESGQGRHNDSRCPRTLDGGNKVGESWSLVRVLKVRCRASALEIDGSELQALAMCIAG